VIAYGTNEAISPRFERLAYTEAFANVIDRLRRASPAASILVVGPPDCQFPLHGRRITYPHLSEVIRIQRQMAMEHGCAFWDWRERMGGPGSVTEWVRAGLGQPDHVHLTSAGYQMVGRMLLGALLDEYSRFQTAKTE
jgi:lysophospholipase L1-like esterase